MTVKITDKYTKEVNNINRCFIVVDGKEYKVTKKIYECLIVGKEYHEHEKYSGYYKIDVNSKWLVPLKNYLK